MTDEKMREMMKEANIDPSELPFPEAYEDPDPAELGETETDRLLDELEIIAENWRIMSINEAEDSRIFEGISKEHHWAWSQSYRACSEDLHDLIKKWRES